MITAVPHGIGAQDADLLGDLLGCFRLVDRNCHQPHHYGLVLAYAHVSYLDAHRRAGSPPADQARPRHLASGSIPGPDE